MDVDGGGGRRRCKERTERRHRREERDHHRNRSGRERNRKRGGEHGHREPDRNHGHCHGQLTGAKVVHGLDKVMEGEDALAMNLKDQGVADAAGDTQQNKIVITEMEEFVLGLQLNEETRKPEVEDVFMDEDDDATSLGALAKHGTSGLAVIKEETDIEDRVKVEEEEEVKPDEVVHEVAVGKGLAGVLKFLQVQGTLNEGTDLGSRTRQ